MLLLNYNKENPKEVDRKGHVVKTLVNIFLY